MSTEFSSSSQHPQLDLSEHVHHRFEPVTYENQLWDLSHLDPFGFHTTINLSGSCEPRDLEVVVIFSSHCFTEGGDAKKLKTLATAEESRLLNFEGEIRLFSVERYNLSKEILVELIKTLSVRRIIVASERENYATFEHTDQSGTIQHYGVFFEVTKSRSRKNRLILRVQSAHLRPLTKRMKEAKPVKLETLLKATFEGRSIRP